MINLLSKATFDIQIDSSKASDVLVGSNGKDGYHGVDEDELYGQSAVASTTVATTCAQLPSAFSPPVVLGFLMNTRSILINLLYLPSPRTKWSNQVVYEHGFTSSHLTNQET